MNDVHSSEARHSRRQPRRGMMPALAAGSVLCFVAGILTDLNGWQLVDLGPVDRVMQALSNFARAWLFKSEPQQDLHHPLLQAAALLFALLMAWAAGTLALSILSRLWTGLRFRLLDFSVGKHVVVCGLGDLGRRLANDFHRGRNCERRRVVAIERDERNSAIDSLRGQGTLVIVGDASDPRVLARARARGAERVFAVTGSDAANVMIARELTSPEAAATRAPTCHVHLTDPLPEAPAAPQLAPGERRDLIQPFNLYQAAARRLLPDALTRRLPSPDQTAHYFILGFDRLGQTLALAVARQAHLGNRKRARITVYDPNVDAKRAAFLDRYPAFCPAPGSLDLVTCNASLDAWDAHDPVVRPPAQAQAADHEGGPGIEYVANAELLALPVELDAERFARSLGQRLLRPGIVPVIFVCHEGDDRQNHRTAMQLRKWLQPFGPLEIYVWLPNFSALTQMMETADEHPIRLVPFGDLATLGAPREIIHPRLDDLAEAIQASSGQRQPGHEPTANPSAATPWNELDEAARRPLRQRADHVDVKLRVLGMRRVPKEGEDRVASFSPAETELLAEIEHHRWLAERLLDGWRYAPRTDPSAKLDAGLVPYARLSEETKAHDRQAAGELLELLDRLGQQAVQG